VFLYTIAGVAVAAGLAVIVAPWLSTDWAGRLRQQPLFTLVFALSALATAGFIGFSLQYRTGLRRTCGVVATTAFLGLAYTGGVVNSLVAVSENTSASVASLKQTLPADVRLVSFGEMDPLFVFHYRDTIDMLAWPRSTADVGPEIAYFAYVEPVDGPVALPFAWEPVATVSCERNQTPVPKRVVRIGRRVDSRRIVDRGIEGMAARDSGSH
jgi:hypothetical protein